MRLSDLHTKQTLSAYQRWELTSFDEQDQIVTTNNQEQNQSQSQSQSQSQLKLAAQKEGFAKGFDEGYQAGLEAGKQAGHEEGLAPLQQELASFTQISTQFSTSLQQAEHVLAQQVLDLALDLAKAMLKSTLTVKPECMIPIVEQAIASLPGVQQPAQLFLHPADAALVRNKIGDTLTDAGWTIVSDAHLQPGDCRVETLHNQINGTFAVRWKQLADMLGRDNQWLLEIESNK